MFCSHIVSSFYRNNGAVLKSLLIGGGLFLTALVLVLFVSISSASAATNPFDITFPIPELGNCGSIDGCKTYCDTLDHASDCLAFANKHGLASDAQVQAAKALPDRGPGGCNSESTCKTYCDDPARSEECLAFAEEHGLIPKEDIQKARVLATKTGPGGCRGEACRTYCNDATHQDECFKFAEENGLLGAQEIEEVKKGREVLQRFGTGPGGCKSERECRTYCDSSDHVEECIAFGERAGFLAKDEAARLRGLAGSGPGGCRGKEQCQAYCDSPDHSEECLTYAVEHNLITKEEGERAKKIAGKTGPGGCRGEAACRAYCEDPAHGDECLKFAEDNGFLPKEEVERAKKFRSLASQAGPGGCQGEAACRDFCENPSNRDACFTFVKDQGLMPSEELARFERGKGLEDRVKKDGGPGGCRDEASCAQYCSDSANSVGCLNFAVEYGGFSREEAQRSLDEFTRYREYGQAIRQRPDVFLAGPEAGQFGPPFPQGPSTGSTTNIVYQQGFPSQNSFGAPGTGYAGYGGFSGPGGCSSPQACAQYCSAHESECRNFYRSGEQQRQEFAPPSGAAAIEFGPGGCRGLSDCLRYCQDPGHRAECSSFGGTPQNLPTPAQFPDAQGQFLGAPGAFPAAKEAPRFCPQIYEPVCGANNATYGNRCEAGYIPIAYNGICRVGPQTGSLPGGCATEDCARQFCSEPSRSGVGECARFSSGQHQEQTCPAGYRAVQGPQAGFYCAPDANPTPTASSCASQSTCEAVCYNASTSDYGTQACIAFRQSRPSPPPTGSCPSGQYWYAPPSGGGGFCQSSTTPPPSTCPYNQYWNGSTCVATGGQTTCDQGLVALLGSGCHYMYNDSSGNQIYCDGPMSKSAKRGDSSTTPGCQAGGGNGQYPGSADSCPGFSYSRWDGQSRRYCQLNNERRCDYDYPSYLTNGPNYTAEKCPASDATTPGPGTGTSSCSTDLVGLLGSGCHYMYNDSSGNQIYCDGPMSKSAKRGDSSTTPGCQAGGNTGTTPSGQREQIWNSLGLRSWVRSDADSARIERLRQACANVPSSSNVWMPGAGDYASPDFGMPDPAKCQQAISCPAGQYWSGSACVPSTTTTTTCPSGQYWNGTSCVSSTTTSSCPSGYHSMGSYCMSDSSSTVCQPAGGGATYTCPGSTTTTTCPSGQYWYVPPSGGTGYCQSSSTTSCTSGQYWNGTSCVSSTSTTACNYNNVCDYGESTGSCPSDCGSSTACPSGQYWYVPPSGGAGYCQSSSTTSCPSGQYWNGTSCVSSTTTSSCPSGYHSMGSYCMSDSSSTVCQPAGGGATYTCPGSTTTTTCPSGQYWYVPPSGGTGYCQSSSTTSCTSGQYWNGTSCVATSSTDCPAGQYWNGSSCVSSTSTSCPSGQYWSGSSCVSSSSTSCPSGQYWNGSSCVSSSTTTCPSGQYWNGTSCVSSSYTPPPTTTTCPSDQYWNGTSCVSSTPAPSPTTTTCPSGQYWNGSSCVSSTPPPQSLVGAVINAFTNAFNLIFGR